MISEEKKKEILAKIGKDRETLNMMNKHDIQGLLAKCKEAGFDVTEGDVTEFIVGSTGEISDDELNAVSGGCGGRCSTGGCTAG